MRSDDEIDEGLYSRQLYVLGVGAMKKLGECKVLISGLGGLGVEIAKNLALAGAHSITLHDDKNVQYSDLSSQFFASKEDIGKNRAEVSRDKIAELNGYVGVNVHTCQLTDSFILQHKAVVLTEWTVEEGKKIGNLCHEQSVYFVLAKTNGLFGQIFCDFGEEFVIIDKMSQPPSVASIEHISKGKNELFIHLSKDSKSSFSEGDQVTFEGVKGMPQLNGCPPINIKEYTNQQLFSIENNFEDLPDYAGGGGMVKEVRLPEKINFKPYEASLVEPEYVSMDPCCDGLLHVAFQVLDEYLIRNHHLPKPGSIQDAAELVEMCINFIRRNQLKVDLDEEILYKFAMVSCGNFGPLQSIIGSIAAQEVVKAATGKFIPIQQWFYFSALEVLPDFWQRLTEEDCAPRQSRYDGQIAIFGSDFQEAIMNAKLFLVGVGAIGCEMLKNWAMMGIGTGDKGHIIVTDMDMIEKSNLNRQFLFRPEHIGKLKSVTAAKVVKSLMNSTMNLEADENKVSVETENIYNDEFFEKLDVVVNALDNIPARRYVSEKCVYHMKPLLESGTEGTLCHVQVILPGLTRTYSGRDDSKEETFPLCTLKYFPTSIEHTIQWARDDFEWNFKMNIKSGQDYRADDHFITNIKRFSGFQPMEKLQEVVEMYQDILGGEYNELSYDKFVRWARKKFEKHFNNQIQQLLYNFPPDSLTKHGLPFWHGSKKCPTPISFDPNNELHVDFIFSAANVMASVFGIPCNISRVQVVEIASSTDVEKFSPKCNIVIPTNDDEAKTQEENRTYDSKEFEMLVKKLPDRKILRNLVEKLNCVDFEKDSDDNRHVDYVTAASNLRANNYNIPMADKLETKRIVGKIIPAIATTTSLVVGLVCIELMKVLSGQQNLKKYKNWYINLSYNSFQRTNVREAEVFEYGDNKMTIWDRFNMDGNPTLRHLIDTLKKKSKLNVEAIFFGSSSLFSPLTPAGEREKRLNMRVSEAIAQVVKLPLAPHIQSVRLDINATDEKGEDIEQLPFVKINLTK